MARSRSRYHSTSVSNSCWTRVSCPASGFSVSGFGRLPGLAFCEADESETLPIRIHDRPHAGVACSEIAGQGLIRTHADALRLADPSTAGSVNLKTEPLPDSDSAQILPP